MFSEDGFNARFFENEGYVRSILHTYMKGQLVENGAMLQLNIYYSLSLEQEPPLDFLQNQVLSFHCLQH